MNVKDYQAQTHRSAQIPDDQVANYHRLQLLAESGEVCGKVAKICRQDPRALADMDETRRQIALELGDIAWSLSEYSQQVEGVACDYDGGGEEPNEWDIASLIDGALCLCAGIHEYIIGATEAERVWEWLEYLSIDIGYTLGQVLDMNAAKLTARLEAGTIKGSGDAR